MKLFRIIATIIAVTLAALGAAIVSTPTLAQATTLEVSGGTPEQATQLQQIVNESQEPTPNLTIPVHIGVCSGGSPDENSCIRYPNHENGWTVPQIWIDPAEHPFVLLHELGHASSWELDPEFQSAGTMSPIEEEFERIVGKPGGKWAIFAGEPGVNESPIEEWADTMLSCSWMGRVATGPTVTTPGYGFVLSAGQYNEVCAFFARVLVGPQFAQPTVVLLPPIPYNYTGSALCGSRPELVLYCGHAAQPQGFGEFHLSSFEGRNAKTPKARKPSKLSKSRPISVRGTRIVMRNPKQRAQFQQIVDESQEPTPNLAIPVHRKNCPYRSAKAPSCVAYPNHENGWTVPQIWISPSAQPFTILGELGYVSWWELDPSTEAATSVAQEFSESFQQIFLSQGETSLAWRSSGAEDSNNESPAHVWADTLLSCSWMGRLVHEGEIVKTVGYGFMQLSAEHNAACAFFLKTLVGPKFSPPTAPPLPTIPATTTGSALCGARPELVKYCGSPTLHRHKKKGKVIKKHHKR